MKEYEFHEAADIFPLMVGKEYEEFVERIRSHGLKKPIVIHEGKILDGRNRYRACRDTETPLRTIDWDDKGSVVDFVWDENYERRHLTAAQKAMAAGHPLAFKHFQKEAKMRHRELSGRPRKNPASQDARFSEQSSARPGAQAKKRQGRGKASNHAAASVHVSPRTVDRARQVYDKNSRALETWRYPNTCSVPNVRYRGRGGCQVGRWGRIGYL